MVESLQPARLGGVLRRRHDHRRLPSLARHVQRVPVTRRGPAGLVVEDPRDWLDTGCRHRGGLPVDSAVDLLWSARHDARVEDPVGTARRQVGPAQVRDQAGQPGQQAEVHDHRRRHRAGRRVGGRLARGARLQRPHLLHPRQPAPRAQHRRAGRHQRRQELQERRRQRVPPVLRHDQGRRLPRARGQRLPPRAALGEHHRPVRGAGRAVRARVRRLARQPLVRRRAGVAHVLRARADGPAAAAGRLPGADAAGGVRQREALPAPRDARPGRRQRQGARHRVPQPGRPARSSATSAMRSSWRPAATGRRTTCPPTR